MLVFIHTLYFIYTTYGWELKIKQKKKNQHTFKELYITSSYSAFSHTLSLAVQVHLNINGNHGILWPMAYASTPPV